MIQIELEPAEARILKAVLDNDLSDLRMEIADTDSMDLREELKARKTVLRRIVTSIEGGFGPKGA